MIKQKENDLKDEMILMYHNHPEDVLTIFVLCGIPLILAYLSNDFRFLWGWALLFFYRTGCNVCNAYIKNKFGDDDND